ncbi:MAG: DNA-3-methyladenine glycosylase [Defluviitaleaceae bacterium]|nr:DNA-3-methyladenine glycosylase [Defluviitaleaceae bacterium]
MDCAGGKVGESTQPGINMNMRLSPECYKQSALSLAPFLIGKILCRKIGEDILRYPITETEAYCGESDTACHSHKGKTPRTSVMYEPGGIAYVYLCYGIHNMLNVVAADVNEPEAVLIRGVEGISGPGRLTKALQIGRDLNRENFTTSDVLWLEDGSALPYIATPRIGIGYASEEDQAQLWRFLHSKEATTTFTKR